MKKIYCVGECALDIIFGADGAPLGAMPGGRVINAAAILARQGEPVSVVSEASAGPVGDRVVDWLGEAGCDITGIDRITEGLTPTLLYLPGADGRMTVTRYESYPDDCFDVVWPRIEEGDVVVFGGFYAIDPRMRRRMSQFLQNAVDHRAVMVYLPGFLPSQAPRITRVMPAIYENLEIADVIITRTADLETIYGTADAVRCYADQIDYYSHSLVNVDSATSTITYFSNHEPVALSADSRFVSSMMWNAGVVAGVAGAIASLPRVTTGEPGMKQPVKVFSDPSAELRREILENAARMADAASEALALDWQRTH